MEPLQAFLQYAWQGQGLTLAFHAHLLGGGYMAFGAGELPCKVRMKEAKVVLQQLQDGIPQDDALQVEGLCCLKRPLHIWGHWEGLMRTTPQRLHQLPHLITAVAQ